MYFGHFLHFIRHLHEIICQFLIRIVFTLVCFWLVVELEREDRESIVNDMKVEWTALVIFCIIFTKYLTEAIYGKKRFIWTPSLRGISIHIDREGMEGLVAVQACDKFSSHWMHLEAENSSWKHCHVKLSKASLSDPFLPARLCESVH